MPDFLLQCSQCGGEAVWDTEVLPPVGEPEVGQPVLWPCAACGREMRHTIADLYVLAEKLHHQICLATELDRQTVDRVMAALYQLRHEAAEATPPQPRTPAQEVAEAAERAGQTEELVEQIAVAETDYLSRRGYLADPPAGG